MQRQDRHQKILTRLRHNLTKHHSQRSVGPLSDYFIDLEEACLYPLSRAHRRTFRAGRCG